MHVVIYIDKVNASLARLNVLDKKERRVAMRKALMSASRAVIREMKSLLRRHYRSGLLIRSIKSKVRYYAKRDTLVLMVGVASNQNMQYKGERIISHKYAHLVDGGRKNFTQDFYAKPFKYYMQKGRPGLNILVTSKWQRVRIRRRVGAVQPSRFVQNAEYASRSDFIKKLNEAIDRLI